MTVREYFKNNRAIVACQVAKRAGISRGVMQQYTAGIKSPSEKRIKKIQQAIYELLDDAGRSASHLSR